MGKLTIGVVLIKTPQKEIEYNDDEPFNFDAPAVERKSDIGELCSSTMPTMEEELASWPTIDKESETEELEKNFKELVNSAEKLDDDFDF